MKLRHQFRYCRQCLMHDSSVGIEKQAYSCDKRRHLTSDGIGALNVNESLAFRDKNKAKRIHTELVSAQCILDTSDAANLDSGSARHKPRTLAKWHGFVLFLTGLLRGCWPLQRGQTRLFATGNHHTRHQTQTTTPVRGARVAQYGQ